MSQTNKKLGTIRDENESSSERTNQDIVNEIITENAANLSSFEDSNGNNIEDENSKNSVCKNNTESITDDIIDEEELIELEKDMTENEKLEAKAKAESLKNDGNDLFKQQQYNKSLDKYTSALKICPSTYKNDRAILYANRAAAKIKIDSKQSAIDDCTKSIELNPNYIRAILRRAKLYEDIEKLDESLEDYKKILELDSKNAEANEALLRLPPLIDDRNEKLKTEMLGKLKDLGNMILKPFGLSTDNFQMRQDPNTGSYSINFQQNQK